MNKTLLAVLAVVGLIAAAGGGYWFGQHRAPGAATGATPPQNPAAAAANAVTVEAIKVASAPMPQTITAVGSLRSDESITVRPEVAGRISAILFNEGQRVGKGATLVKLDPSINQADVEQARANLKLAKSKFDRAVARAPTRAIGCRRGLARRPRRSSGSASRRARRLRSGRP